MRNPSYRLLKPSGRAVVTPAGKDRYLGAYNSLESKRLYRRLLAEYLANDGAVRPKQCDESSVAELLAAFLKYAKRHFGDSDNTQFEHFQRLVKRIHKLYGDRTASNFGASQFKAIRMQLVEVGKARTYVNETRRCAEWLESSDGDPARASTS